MTEALPLPQTVGSATIPLNALIYTVNKPTLAEKISSSTSLSTVVDSIIDTSTGTLSCTLASASDDNQCKTVRLLHRAANTATVSCAAAGGGTFQLTPDDPMRKLRYNSTTGCWQIEDGTSVTTPTPDSFYPTTQQGTKLVGTAVTGTANFGWSNALSADGNTLAIGGYGDNANTGAVWIYTRSGSTWALQSGKIVGTGTTGTAHFGRSVSLSADGNTLAVGGSADNAGVGAVWVFTRSGTTWTQQGAKLVGTGMTGAGSIGYSVSLSADGNTLASGAYNDDGGYGASWVFTRSSGTWTQQGTKLLGASVTGAANIGVSITLSADGNTLAAGGYGDNNVGAVWVYTRSGTTWTGGGSFGESVDLSANGNTLAVGGSSDNSNAGAVWMFTRSAGVWSAQGSKLVGTGITGGSAAMGISIAISADGNTLVAGGSYDNTNVGAVWVFTRSGTTWSQKGSKLVGTGETGSGRFGNSVALSANGNTLVSGAFNDYGVGAVWVFT